MTFPNPSLPVSLVCLLLSLAPCASCAAPVEAGDPSATLEAAAPLLGAADGTDGADRECGVVLREVHREAGATGGFATSCPGGGPCWFVWSGTFDVRTELVGAGAPGVLFRSSWSPERWWEVGATAVEGAGPGFARFLFRLSEHTAPDGASFTSLARTRIELVPFARRAGGGRLFDHNAHPGDFDNHVLAQENAWSIAEDASVCRAGGAQANLVFRAGWTHAQHGPIVRGGRLSIDYDLARLPQCFGARYNGLSAFGTVAYARFLPGGQQVSGSVKGVELAGGGFSSVPLTVEVPRDAERVELWFGTSGRGCISAWDSHYGQNYGFAVVASPPAPVQWAGDWGGSFARDCAHRDGLGDPIVLDGYVRERACSFVDADVYVPGLTDGAEAHPEHVRAELELTLDGGEPRYEWLSFVGRVGNNYRYRWELPRAQMTSSPWSELGFAFRFSTDGDRRYRIATGAGPEGGEARRIVRGPTW